MSAPEIPSVTPVQIAETICAFGWVPIGLNGKAPIAKEWQKTSMSGAIDKVKGFYQVNQQINVGVLTGKASGIVVADIEGPNVQAWLQLVQDRGMPETFIIMTGSSGFHYYFKRDDRVAHISSTKIKGFGDYLADGRQAVFAGSINYEKQTMYTIVRGYEPDPQTNIRYPQVGVMPDWLINLIVTGNPDTPAPPAPAPLQIPASLLPVKPPTINLPPTMQVVTQPPTVQQAVTQTPVNLPPTITQQVVPTIPAQATVVEHLPAPTVEIPVPTVEVPTIPLIPNLIKPLIPTIQPTITN